MKTLKLLFGLFLSVTLLSSCVVTTDDDFNNYIPLEDLVNSYDLWYIDINRTQLGSQNQEIAFLSEAFTISFENGRLYSNKNLVGIGSIGNGFGLPIGFYDTYNNVLEVDHNKDGFINLTITQRSVNEIALTDEVTGVTYYLIGYQRNQFDYDLVFYDNIEYFLQEYHAWEKIFASQEGALNEFDEENFVEFRPISGENVFRSSKDQTGTPIDKLIWDFEGNYEVFNVEDRDDLKILTLDYDYFDGEEFELSVIDDAKISLFHRKSGTTYEFDGLGNIQYKNGKANKLKPRNKKRFKTNRKTKKIQL